MSDIALLALIVAAIGTGYVLGRRGRSHTRHQVVKVNQKHKSGYITGINYLIDEQNEAAINRFIKSLDFNEEMFESYLALGHLFRKRGDIDKSIRIYQELLAKNSLTKDQSIQVQLELAKNYSTVGLINRAESILTEVSQQNSTYKENAFQQLLKVYEQEQDWEKAIDMAKALARSKHNNYQRVLAHYYCELAEIALKHNNRLHAFQLTRTALSADKSCVRASLLQGQLYSDGQNYKEAIKALTKIHEQDIFFTPLSLPLLEHAFTQNYAQEEYQSYLKSCLKQQPLTAIAVALTKQIHFHDGKSVAIQFLTQFLTQHPTLTGLHQLQALFGQTSDEENEQIKIIEQLLKPHATFKCQHCGFSGGKLYWHCPACQFWGSIKPTDV